MKKLPKSKSLLSAVSIFLAFAIGGLAAKEMDQQPNIIFFLTYDQGYADLGCFGSKDIATPNIDRLCREGIKFTSFYATNRCSPTRLAFMTGSFPQRAGWDKVIYRKSKVGIHSDEITVSERLRDAGYATGIVGKWHLGEFPQFNPVHHGFDFFYGFMECGGNEGKDEGLKGLFRNTEFVEKTGQKTDGEHSPKLLKAGIDFIRSHKDKPFFLYYASPLPHTKWIPNKRFAGSSKQGTYGDVIQEIDWQVGELMGTLEELGLEKNTLVVFTSDNGPQLNVDGHGSAEPFRDGKWTNFEGGIRVPCVMRWPAIIPSGSINNEIASVMDLAPTFWEIAGIKIPAHTKIDGRSILPYLKGETLSSPIHKTFIVPGKTIRHGQWKLLTADQKPGGKVRKGHGKQGRIPAKAGSLFNLKDNPGESTDLSLLHPEKTKQLKSMMEKMMQDLSGSERPIGKVH